MENTIRNTDEVEKHEFKLFVSGMSVKSGHAIENLQKIAEKYLGGNFEIEIIDINRDRHKAAEYQIVAIPTLIRTSPAPVRTILGDLSDTNKVLQALNLRQNGGNEG